MDQLETIVRTFADTQPWQGQVPVGCFPNFLGVMTEQAFVSDFAPSNHVLSVNGKKTKPRRRSSTTAKYSLSRPQFSGR